MDALLNCDWLLVVTVSRLRCHFDSDWLWLIDVPWPDWPLCYVNSEWLFVSIVSRLLCYLDSDWLFVSIVSRLLCYLDSDWLCAGVVALQWHHMLSLSAGSTRHYRGTWGDKWATFYYYYYYSHYYYSHYYSFNVLYFCAYAGLTFFQWCHTFTSLGPLPSLASAPYPS